jgi:nitrilase
MATSHLIFRAAVVQAAADFLDLDGCITKAIDLIKEASAKGAKLIAFPET